MKHLLIIYPHWPPSNLAGVHRSRLISNFSTDFGWKTTLLTVDEQYYEETLDPDIERLVSQDIEVHKVAAYSVLKVFGKRLIGDIGLRGWLQMRQKMLDLIEAEHFDFIWIPIPSWYTSLLGRVAWKRHRVPFGIDYIDPWVYQLTERDGPLTREWWTIQVARRLEPLAIHDAKLISGVAKEYYRPALERVFKKKHPRPIDVAMPYGFDPSDHVVEPAHLISPWGDETSQYLLYAGAFLPHSELFMRKLFSSLKKLLILEQFPENLKLRFVGTGVRNGASISQLALEYGVNDVVEEYPNRIPFLSIQTLLRRAQGALVIGSTESHYTASKTFQCLLAEKPIFAIFHQESSAASFLKQANASSYLVTWQEENTELFEDSIDISWRQFVNMECTWAPDLSKLEPYSSRESARLLFEGIEQCLST